MHKSFGTKFKDINYLHVDNLVLWFGRPPIP